MFIYLVSEVDTPGPLFTSEERANKIAAQMRLRTDTMIDVSRVVLDPTDEEAIEILTQSWHVPPDNGCETQS